MSTSTVQEKGRVRLPAVAGQFYSADPLVLREHIERLVAQIKNPRRGAKAIIVPHAAYAFSGAVAASAYACFHTEREVIRRVVLVGPSHRVPFSGVAGSRAQAFLTPLGPVPVSRQGMETMNLFPPFAIRDEAHLDEHSLEVQLPFLQVVLKQFEIVPLLTGDISDEDVTAILNALWDEYETRLVISSDLSHYHDYWTARLIDRATTNAIESLKPAGISVEQACGSPGIRGLLLAAQGHDVFCQTLDLRNSGDKGGPHTSVVGYGAFGFFQH